WWRRLATQTVLRGAVGLTRCLGPSGARYLGRAVGGLAGFTGPLRQRLTTNLKRVGIAPTETVLDGYFRRFGCWTGWSLAIYHAGFAASGVAARMVFHAS